jgi:TP901 family phage tail tape measure protein
MATAARVKAGEAFVAIEALDKTGYVLNRISKRMSNWSKQITDMGRKAVIGATLAALPIGLSTKVFAGFDDSMRKVEARTVGTAAEMKDLRNQAEDLGRTTSFTAAQVGELMAVLGQKGFNRNQIGDMTPHVMNLARGAGEGKEEDLPLSAALTSNAMRIFRLDSKDSARVADVLTKAVNSSALSLESLTEAFKYLGPLPHKTNMSLEETVATLGMLGNLGIEGSMSGTAIRGMILSLSDATKRAKFGEMLKDMTGKTVELVDASGQMKKPVDILFEMGAALKGIGSANQLEALGQLFGDRQLVSADAISEGIDSFTELKGVLEDAAGTAAKTAKTMDEGTGGALRQFVSAIEGVQIAVGKALEPILIGVGDRVTEVVTQFARWIDANQDTVTGVVALVAVVGTLGVGLIGLGLAMKVASVGLAGLAAIATTTRVTLLAVAASCRFVVVSIRLVTSAVLIQGVVLGTYRAALMAARAGVLAFRAALLLSAGGLLVAQGATIAGRVALLGIAATGRLAAIALLAYGRAMWALTFGIAMWAATRTAVTTTTTALVVYRGTVATVRTTILSASVAIGAMRAAMTATAVTVGILYTAFDILRAFILATIVAVRTFGLVTGLVMAARFAIAGVATAISTAMTAVMGAVNIGAFLTSIAAGVASLFSALAAGVVAILPFVIGLGGLAAGLVAVAVAAWAVWPVLVALFGIVKQFAASAFGALGTAASDVGAILSESLLPAISKLMKLVPMAWSGISAALAGGDLKRAAQLAVLGIKAALLTINDVLIQIVGVGKKLWVDLSTAFKVAMIAATAAVQKRMIELFTGLVDTITSLPGGEWFAEKWLGAGYKDWLAAMKLAPGVLDNTAKKDSSAAQADAAAQKKVIDAQTKVDRATNEKERRAAEEELRNAVNQAKLIRALQTLTPFGWLGAGKPEKGGPQSQAKPTQDLTTPKKPLEALQGLEKGTLEAAKAFIEAQDPQNQLLSVAKSQAASLEQIVDNTSQPPIEVEVVG